MPGFDRNFVVNSHDVLNGKAAVTGNAVVIGGGMVGVETAEYLAEKKVSVTVLEMLPEICADLGAPRKICVNESVYAAGIVPVTGVTVKEIRDGEVIGEKDGAEISFPCDYAVMAVGAKKRDGSALAAACYENGTA